VVIPALLSGLLAAYPMVMTIRSYFQDLDVMKEQLLNMSFDATRSFCYEHQDKDGNPFPCDRKVVKECVKIWFASQEEFEHVWFGSSEVLDTMILILRERVFTNTWVQPCNCSTSMGQNVDLSASFRD